MKNSKIFRNRIILLFDIIGAVFIYFASVLFVLGFKAASISALNNYMIAVCIVVYTLVIYQVNGLYRVLWPYAGSKDYMKLCLSAVIMIAMSLLTIIVVKYVFPNVLKTEFSIMLKICGLGAVTTAIYTAFVRMLIRVLVKIPVQKNETHKEDSVHAIRLCANDSPVRYSFKRENIISGNSSFASSRLSL